MSQEYLVENSMLRFDNNVVSSQCDFTMFVQRLEVVLNLLYAVIMSISDIGRNIRDPVTAVFRSKESYKHRLTATC